jgi:flagellar biosynthesis/type III secretory pathway M-ring protein FliF/YscJ
MRHDSLASQEDEEIQEKEDKVMIKNKFLGWLILLALALVVFLAVGVNTGEAKQATKASKTSKSLRKDAPP